MAKKYQQIKSKISVAKEPEMAYGKSRKVSFSKVQNRGNIEHAISGEELLNRLRPRIKALFE